MDNLEAIRQTQCHKLTNECRNLHVDKQSKENKQQLSPTVDSMDVRYKRENNANDDFDGISTSLQYIPCSLGNGHYKVMHKSII